MKSNVFNVLYRVCDSVENYNSSRTTGRKIDVILKSFSSICDSVSLAKKKIEGIEIPFHIVYDKTGVETKNKFKEIAKERYMISKHTNTSYSDTANITPSERAYILQFIVEDLT